MLREYKSELDLLEQAFIASAKENPEDYNCEKLGRYYYDEKGNSFTPYIRFFGYLVAYNKFGGFPCIVSDKDYKKINAEVVYHGFKDPSHALSLIFDYNYHLGVYKVFGTYFSNKKLDAKNYTWATAKNKLNQPLDYVKWDKKRVLQAKVVSDNFIHIDKIKEIQDNMMYSRDFNQIENLKDRQKLRELYEYCFKYEGFEEDIKKGEYSRADFFSVIVGDPKTLALYLGYDYMLKNSPEKDRSKHTVVFNRNKIVIPESEVLRFSQASNNHAGDNYKLSSLDEIYNSNNSERT